MKKAVCPLLCILLGLSLAACRSQVAYRECPDEAALGECFELARNDLLQGTFYCGSDASWHYFVVKRRLFQRGVQGACHNRIAISHQSIQRRGNLLGRH